MRIQISFRAEIDPDEFPESKLAGSLEDQLKDHTRVFSRDILGDENPTHIYIDYLED